LPLTICIFFLPGMEQFLLVFGCRRCIGPRTPSSGPLSLDVDENRLLLFLLPEAFRSVTILPVENSTFIDVFSKRLLEA